MMTEDVHSEPDAMRTDPAYQARRDVFPLRTDRAPNRRHSLEAQIRARFLGISRRFLLRADPQAGPGRPDGSLPAQDAAKKEPRPWGRAGTQAEPL
jgi:hypothetical protein